MDGKKRKGIRLEIWLSLNRFKATELFGGPLLIFRVLLLRLIA
jgi:hypothetical protein